MVNWVCKDKWVVLKPSPDKRFMMRQDASCKAPLSNELKRLQFWEILWDGTVYCFNSNTCPYFYSKSQTFYCLKIWITVIVSYIFTSAFKVLMKKGRYKLNKRTEEFSHTFYSILLFIRVGVSYNKLKRSFWLTSELHKFWEKHTTQYDTKPASISPPLS